MDRSGSLRVCTGDGLCSEIAPDCFQPRDDGLWVVKEEEKHFGKTTIFDGVQAPDGAKGLARVPDSQLNNVIEAAEECPGDCIYIESSD